MRVIDVLRRLVHNSDNSAKSLSEAAALLDRILSETAEVTDGIAGQSDLINRKLSEAVAGITHQSDLINRRLSEAVAGISNQSELINRGTAQAVAGITNQSELLHQKLSETVDGIQDISGRINTLVQTVEQLVSRIDSLFVSRMDSLLELQKAEIVMQRDQAEAIDELAKVLHGALPSSNAGPSPARQQE
jgi:methyl-accepting chemotaxis protein